ASYVLLSMIFPLVLLMLSTGIFTTTLLMATKLFSLITKEPFHSAFVISDSQSCNEDEPCTTSLLVCTFTILCACKPSLQGAINAIKMRKLMNRFIMVCC